MQISDHLTPPIFFTKELILIRKLFFFPNFSTCGDSTPAGHLKPILNRTKHKIRIKTWYSLWSTANMNNVYRINLQLFFLQYIKYIMKIFPENQKINIDIYCPMPVWQDLKLWRIKFKGTKNYSFFNYMQGDVHNFYRRQVYKKS